MEGSEQDRKNRVCGGGMRGWHDWVAARRMFYPDASLFLEEALSWFLAVCWLRVRGAKIQGPEGGENLNPSRVVSNLF